MPALGEGPMHRSATSVKRGTRKRGNDGKMWEVRKSGRSQRWFRGAESFEALGEPDAPYDQGYDDQQDESLGERNVTTGEQSGSGKGPPEMRRTLWIRRQVASITMSAQWIN